MSMPPEVRSHAYGNQIYTPLPDPTLSITMKLKLWPSLPCLPLGSLLSDVTMPKLTTYMYVSTNREERNWGIFERLWRNRALQPHHPLDTVKRTTRNYGISGTSHLGREWVNYAVPDTVQICLFREMVLCLKTPSDETAGKQFFLPLPSSPQLMLLWPAIPLPVHVQTLVFASDPLGTTPYLHPKIISGPKHVTDLHGRIPRVAVSTRFPLDIGRSIPAGGCIPNIPPLDSKSGLWTYVFPPLDFASVNVFTF
ncbi:hypothetical protein SODALDRAFT_377822 [Sodiomyces alkalinus F11]|uniref:Uncharacterized protein n=1 Tax=Sodiomyces alkalinus (strain CBS 110278 / VKM F-3762 / F11) TaxID=1314773 RepID=A0A3N2PZH2_SODAK|nr:hypothetical protein SODALDRAFT_377822 [Sodiomyces alkalinus F11]ROT39920.1 hypothetical protein SODALDRAFT_377822 [Sodiomyces alkalinus F11]